MALRSADSRHQPATRRETALLRLIAAIGLLFGLLAPAFAAAPTTTFDTPLALLTYAYQPYTTGQFKDDNVILYSRGLNALFAAAEANTPEDDVGPVDFDVFVNGQDYQLTELKIGDPAPEGAGVSVPVTLKNFDDPQSLVFHLIREGGSWRINDIESLTPGSTWKLSDLLTAPPATSNDNSGTDSSNTPGSAPTNN
jgi:hypothetical protein